jgi:proline iminopeptidase
MRVDIGGGIRLFVDIDGAGLVPDGPAMVERPTVVLLHGGPGMDHSLFKSETYDLSDVAQVVYYDHRGNGRSDHGSTDDWTLDVWADDVVRLCEALGIEQPVVVGESFGGFVAQRYLARHPGHPSRVALLCTAPRMDIDLVGAAFERRGGDAAGTAAREFWTRGPEAIGDYLVHCMPLYDVDPGDPDVIARVVLNFELMGHFQAVDQPTMDLRAGLAAATCPVLVAGGELDPVCPIEMSEEIVAALVNAQVAFERYSDASHGDVGRRAAATLRAFIAG